MTNPVHRILLPSDFSEGSREALKFAATYAHQIGAELRLLHVIDLPHFAYGDFETTTVSGETLHSQSVQQARRRLRDELKHLPDVLRQGTECAVRTGGAAQEITAEAESANCDLILLATHGRTGLKRMLMGSVAERIVRTAPCPVLTGKFGAVPVPGATGPARILVATDTSELALAGLQYAIGLAGVHTPPAELDLVYVLEDITTLPAVEWQEFPDITPELFYARGEERATAKLREIIQQQVPDEVNCTIHVLRGDPVTRLIDFAGSNGTELVVATTHGWTGLRHVMVGSVAEKLARLSPCPVLTAKSPLPDGAVA
ncbi:MAG: universal stress protein [Planctomycetota bacterium]